MGRALEAAADVVGDVVAWVSLIPYRWRLRRVVRAAEREAERTWLECSRCHARLPWDGPTYLEPHEGCGGNLVAVVPVERSGGESKVSW